jgi:hypothetical protein
VELHTASRAPGRRWGSQRRCQAGEPRGAPSSIGPGALSARRRRLAEVLAEAAGVGLVHVLDVEVLESLDDTIHVQRRRTTPGVTAMADRLDVERLRVVPVVVRLGALPTLSAREGRSARHLAGSDRDIEVHVRSKLEERPQVTAKGLVRRHGSHARPYPASDPIRMTLVVCGRPLPAILVHEDARPPPG